MKMALLMLAAGQSQRFNGIKQLADVHGQPMLVYCLEKYRQSGQWLAGIDTGCVVLGANVDNITEVLPSDIDTYLASSWAQGMGASLAQAVTAIATDISHVLVALGDQVAITPTDIQSLLNLSKQHPAKIVAAQYHNKFGAPAIFPKHCFSQLAALKGDQGAKSLLQKYSDDLQVFDMPNAGFDVDTSEDFLAFLSQS